MLNKNTDTYAYENQTAKQFRFDALCNGSAKACAQHKSYKAHHKGHNTNKAQW